MNNMFCYQCQETFCNEGCVKSGVCGKKPEVANKQDLLIWLTKGLSQVTTALRAEGKKVSQEINSLVTHNLFTTITNANFNEDAIDERIEKTIKTTKALKSELSEEVFSEASNYEDLNRDNWAEVSKKVGVLSTEDEDERSLRELVIYGLKGLSAYTVHAEVLGKTNEEIDSFIQRALSETLEEKSIDELFNLVVETGEHGVKGMALLDEANTSSYGNPEISKVNIGVRNNPAILISGHDLKDMEMLLEQTEGTGVDVYTHSEMLPANYYPKFKKYDHFVGNYGS